MFVFFFFNDTATTEIYTLSLHDALPIWHSATASSPMPAAPPTSRASSPWATAPQRGRPPRSGTSASSTGPTRSRSEEHTSELQSRQYLVCRLLLEKTKDTYQLRYCSVAY